MRLTILFFGMLKDLVGASREELELPEPAFLSAVWEHYVNHFPRLGEMKSHLRLALNREFSGLNAPLSEGDEIAFLPPVSGGSADEFPLVAITREPIDTQAWVRRVKRPEDGAIVTFEGVVRNNTASRATRFLDYEGYEPMALHTMRSLASEIGSRYPIGRMGIVHRLGRMEIGDASVVIVVSAPHRAAAFAACREAIDRLKSTVPIWKKEYFEDGAVWVEGSWSDAASTV